MKMSLAFLITAAMLLGLTGCAGEDKTPSAGAPQAREQWVYTVKPGDDSYAAIAKQVYGDRSLAGKIADANPKIQEHQLQAGTRLVIPVEPGVTPPARGCQRVVVY